MMSSVNEVKTISKNNIFVKIELTDSVSPSCSN